MDRKSNTSQVPISFKLSVNNLYLTKSPLRDEKRKSIQDIYRITSCVNLEKEMQVCFLCMSHSHTKYL